MNPKNRYFLTEYCPKIGLRILQISTTLFCSNIYTSFEIDFFFSKPVYHVMPPGLDQK